MTFYAMIDPNWGQPLIISDTIRDTENAVWQYAVSPNGNSKLKFYSFASAFPLPYGTYGDRKALENQGYKVKKVKVIITDD